MKQDANDLVLRELTAPLPGAVSVLELRGRGALERVGLLAPGVDLRVGGLRLVRLEHGGEFVDEALVWAAEGTRVEIHLHGSPALVRRVVRALGLELAAPATGDRSLEERAWEAAAVAPTEAGARVLLDQAEGSLRAEFAILARAEPGEFLRRIGELVRRSRALEALFQPPCVVLAGPPNAGKSTLFNALVGYERVVVDATRGTTRDAVRERIAVGAYAIDLVDTAGVHEFDAHEREADAGDEPRAALERAGQALGRAYWERARLILWLQPVAQAGAAVGPRGVDPERWVRIRTREDERVRPRGPGEEAGISALRDARGARETVIGVLAEALGFPAQPWTPAAPVLFDTQEWQWARRALHARDPSALAGIRAELDSLLVR